MNAEKQQMIRTAYAAFNKRDIDTILGLMQPDVHWPRGFDGGFVSGHEAVRDYWTKQWKEIDPHVAPAGFRERGDDMLEVAVRQVVKDLQGNLIADGMVKHIYRFREGLIAEMNIENP